VNDGQTQVIQERPSHQVCKMMVVAAPPRLCTWDVNKDRSIR